MRTPQPCARAAARVEVWPDEQGPVSPSSCAWPRQSLMEPPSGGKRLMSTGSDLINSDRQSSEPGRLSEKTLDRLVRRVSRYRAARSQGHPDGLPADLRHDHQPRHRRGRGQQGKDDPLQVLRGPGKRRPGRHLRPGTDLDQFCQHPEERRQRLRNGAASPAPARAGRQLEEHAGAAAEEGAGTIFARRRGEPLQLRLEGRRARRRRDLLPPARCTRSRCT